MHPVGPPQQQQQQQQRRGNSTRMPLMYSNSLPPVPLLQGPPPALRYGNPGTYQQLPVGTGGGMKHHQRGGGNRNGRGGLAITHRQQRPTAGPRYHPYQFRPPLPPQQQQQRFYRPAHFPPRTPAALMGTPPGMSQSEYEPIHHAQVQRDKEKLVRLGHVLAPSNTTQFLIRDHNRQTTPSSIATPTPTHPPTVESSPLNVQNHESPAPLTGSLTYDQMFDMGDVDAQSDDMESNQDGGIVGVDQAFDNDFNDIYYQCRYERYAAFSRANLLNEVLSLCANIDRLQHEKSEVEKRLRDVQQHLYDLTSTPSATATATNQPKGASQERSTNDDGNDEDSRMKSPLPNAEDNDSSGRIDENPLDEGLQASSSSQPAVVEQQEIIAPSMEDNTVENNEHEQQLVHD